MATTLQRSKRTFAFTTTPSTSDAQYSRKEMERLTDFLLKQLDDLDRLVAASASTPAVDYSKPIENILKSIQNLTLAIAAIPVINTSIFLQAVDLQPIIVSGNFTRTISVAFGKIAVFFDGTENNGDITNEGVILVL